MAKYRPIYLRIWSDRDFFKYTTEQKAVYIYFFANPETTESGVYPCMLERVAFDTSKTLEEIEDIITNVFSDKIKYDPENQVVWVKNFLKHNGLGNPRVVIGSILKDYENIKSTVWEGYWEFNGKHIVEIIEKYVRVQEAILESKLTLPQPLVNLYPTLKKYIPISNQPLPRVNQDLPRVNGENDQNMQVAENITPPTLTQPLVNHCQPLDEFTPNSPPITIPITIPITNYSKGEKIEDDLSLSDYYDETQNGIDKKDVEKIVDGIIKLSNSLYNREGFFIEPDNFHARGMIAKRIIEDGSEKVKAAMQYAKEFYFPKLGMHHNCTWKILFRSSSIDDNYEKSKLARPGINNSKSATVNVLPEGI